MLEVLKYILIFYSLSFSTMIFYKVTKTYQLINITISALCILLIYPMLISRTLILITSCVFFYLSYSYLFYWLNKKSSHYKYEFDISIIEIAVYSLFTYIIFIFFTRDRLDNYLITNYALPNITLIVILFLFFVLSIVLSAKYALVSKIKLWSSNQSFYRTIFSEKETKRLFVLTNTTASIMFVLAIVLLSLDKETQISYGTILEYYLYGLSIWLICGDQLYKMFLCSIFLSIIKICLWEHTHLNENWIFFLLLSLGIITNILKENYGRSNIISNIAD